MTRELELELIVNDMFILLNEIYDGIPHTGYDASYEAAVKLFNDAEVTADIENIRNWRK